MMHEECQHRIGIVEKVAKEILEKWLKGEIDAGFDKKEAAINYADFGVVDVIYCQSLEIPEGYYVLKMSEASPDNNRFCVWFANAIASHPQLQLLGRTTGIEVECEW